MSDRIPNTVLIADELRVGGQEELVIFAGPCVIESRDSALRHAEKISSLAEELSVPLVYKSSYDKANRTSRSSYRGPGLEEGLKILAEIKQNLGLRLITDVHSSAEVRAATEVVDVIQIPAFMCRQTDLLLEAGASQKPVLLKKGQFLSPEDVKHLGEKIGEKMMICERGSSFGYRTLVVDFAAFPVMKSFGYPIVFDGTHSVQLIGGAGGSSGGRREAIPSLCRAAVAVGVSGLFLEVHEDPASGLSDAASMLSLEEFKALLPDLKTLHHTKLITRG